LPSGSSPEACVVRRRSSRICAANCWFLSRSSRIRCFFSSRVCRFGASTCAWISLSECGTSVGPAGGNESSIDSQSSHCEIIAAQLSSSSPSMSISSSSSSSMRTLSVGGTPMRSSDSSSLACFRTRLRNSRRSSAACGNFSSYSWIDSQNSDST
jgi:hypothetical protein